MSPLPKTNIDVGIIGGGPAGISAAIELGRQTGLETAIFESESSLGGMPLRSHFVYGFRDLHRIYKGKQYINKLRQKLARTRTKVCVDTTVIKLEPEVSNRHLIDAVSSDGYAQYHCRAVLLATGCCERSRESRRLPGDRVSGIFTTGAIQELINQKNLVPGTQAVVIGSELIALAAMVSLQKAGIRVIALIGDAPTVGATKWLAPIFCKYHTAQHYRQATIHAIGGRARVARISFQLPREKQIRNLECDTVVVTGHFRPESQLIDHTSIRLDPATEGPAVDAHQMTSVPRIYTAGNVIRGARMHDACAIEGRQAARYILQDLGFD